MNALDYPADVLLRVKRPDGTVKWLRVPAEHWPRVLELAAGEFGDKSIDLGGPELPKESSKRA